MDQLEIELAVLDEGRRRHPELELESAVALLKLNPPGLLAVQREGDQVARSDMGPDVDPVAGRRCGCQIARSLHAPGQLPLPPRLAVRAHAQQDQLLAVGSGRDEEEA